MNFWHLISPPVTPRQVNALAGVAQAVVLTDSLAQKGHCEPNLYARNVASLLQLDPETDEDVYGLAGELNAGLNMLTAFCNGEDRTRQARYLAQILYLQKRLMKRENLLEKIRTGLDKSNRQLEFYGIESDAIALSIEDLYQQTLSTMGYRIQVFGNPEFLGQPRVSSRVRTMLFSGVRFALLWRQLGGHSRQLIFAKRQIADISSALCKDNS